MELSFEHADYLSSYDGFLTEAASAAQANVPPEEVAAARKFYDDGATDAYIEECEISRAAGTALLPFGRAVFHGAAFVWRQKAWIFAAPSGTGKTTHIKLWQRLYGDRVEIINGDKPLFTLRSGRFFASGMPWCGKENWGCNKTVPLKAICFIDRAEHNSISPLEDNREIMSRLFLQLVMPEEHRLMVKYLDFANKLINTVSFYLLRCNMDLSAAQTAHDGIFGIE